MSIETEKAYLSAILHNEEILYKVNISPDDLIDVNHRLILQACKNISGAGNTPDLVSVANELKQSVNPAVIAGITSMGATQVNWKFYTDKLVAEIMQRRIERLPAEINEMLRAGENVKDILSKTGDYLDKVSISFNQYKIEKASEFIPEWHDALEKKIEAKGNIKGGIPTGFPKIDEITTGWKKRSLVYVGARPSQGKSALLANFASAAIDANYRAGIVTVESSKKEIIERMVSSKSMVPLSKFKNGLMGSQDQFKESEATAHYYGAPLFFYDEPNANIQNVIAQARRMVTVDEVDVIFVDYCQLIQPSNRSMSRVEQVSEISIKLKNLARDLNIPIVCAAQLRRDAENRAPQLSDFADTSQIEKDADVAILIEHKKAVDPSSGEERVESFLHIDKHRDGETASVPVFFKKEIVTFYERNI